MARRRPLLHFTPPTGWTNDPHAIAWLDRRYHLFHQANPAAPVWVPGISWGHASSPDLFDWALHPAALVPGDGDDGCWSGGIAVHPETGAPTLLYTSVHEPDLDAGSVRLATPGPTGLVGPWQKLAGTVIDAAPTGFDAVALRDPAPWWDGSTWRLLLGTGRRGIGGAVLQYSSPDLQHWQCDGVLLQGRRGADEAAAAGFDSGEIWECPQLVRLDASWLLLISPCGPGLPQQVLAAVGDYDGQQFTPRRWARFGAGIGYATTLFSDAVGRPCGLSWLPERPDVAPEGWAGALSLPFVLELDDDRVLARPHPNLLGRRGIGAPVSSPASGPATSTERFDLTWSALEVVVRSGELKLLPGDGGEPVTVAATAGPVTAVVDADIVEIYDPAGDGVTVMRWPVAPRTVELQPGPGAAATAYPLGSG